LQTASKCLTSFSMFTICISTCINIQCYWHYLWGVKNYAPFILLVFLGLNAINAFLRALPSSMQEAVADKENTSRIVKESQLRRTRSGLPGTLNNAYRIWGQHCCATMDTTRKKLSIDMSTVLRASDFHASYISKLKKATYRTQITTYRCNTRYEAFRLYQLFSIQNNVNLRIKIILLNKEMRF